MSLNLSESVGIELKNIDLSYGKNHVIKDISLNIKQGEFFTFLGPSGCGKSTLLRLIAGFEYCQQGEVYIGNKEVSKLSPWKRNVGMVFQNYALWPHMTVRKNVSFGLEERKVPKNEIESRVKEALELVDLLDFAERRPNQLSGGQQQRVALARTLVIEPKVLLLDEPLSNLDAKLRVRMRQELLELQRKLSLTTIFVTHDQEEANTTSDRIAVLDDGVVQQVGSPMELYDRPVNTFVAKFLGTANMVKGIIKKENDKILFSDGNDLSIYLNNTKTEGQRTIIFRPQNVTICEQDGEIKGIVKFREFLGNIVRYVIIVGNQQLIVDEVYGKGRTPTDIGAEVELQLDKNHILVMD